MREEKSSKWGEAMKTECGICEFKGNLRDAPLFVCFNCGDAIRRLVWIQEQQPNLPMELEPPMQIEGAKVRPQKSAVLVGR
jgi:hypothetical protein